MGKKKADQQNKQKVIKFQHKEKLKRLKQAEALDTMKKLEQFSNLLQKDQFDQMESIKKINCKKKKIRIQIVQSEQSSSEEPEPEKKPKIEILNQPLGFNLFEQKEYINPDAQPIPVQQVIKVQDDKYYLENQAKKAFPDLNLDGYEGEKNQEELLIEENKQPKLEDLQLESEDEQIQDKNLVEMLEKQTTEFNQILTRDPDIEQSRFKLPIYQRESEILEAINQNLVTVICGETGSGKSTQVPQFLYEAGYSNKKSNNPGMIGITQPRRIAAIQVAKRVCTEMNAKMGSTVVYQVRHETSQFDENSQIKFMTDGILLNEMNSDFLLQKYSVIIIDEAHERKVNTDLLIGLLSRLTTIRKKLSIKENSGSHKYYPLRLVIMSATLRVTDFSENKFLFPQKLPVINIESRQFPVNIYFSKRTEQNYLDEVVKKCVNIHNKLPQGDILVFLTGEREIKEFCINLQQQLKKIKPSSNQDEGDFQEDDFCLNELSEDDDKEQYQIIQHNPINSENLQNKKKRQDQLKYMILPLFSKLPVEEQEMIFRDHDPETRMIIAATNVAETSITIPKIKYVVDCGKEKKKIFSTKLSISRHVIQWISQSSAQQRSGRSGRTFPGYCYRMYTPSVYTNQFEAFSEPEIICMPLENVILLLKSAGIKNILEFPFPTVPKIDNIAKAMQNLIKIKALFDRSNTIDMDEEIQEDQKHKFEDHTDLTDLGRILAMIPLNPKYGKMILQGRQHGVLGYVLLIVSYLSVEEIFDKNAFKIQTGDDELIPMEEDLSFDSQDHERRQSKEQIQLLENFQKQKKNLIQKNKKANADFKVNFDKFFQGNSDLLMGMNVLGFFLKEVMKENRLDIDNEIYKYAKNNYLISKSLKEVYYNLIQLIDIINNMLEEEAEKIGLKDFFNTYNHPTPDKINQLISIIMSSFIDQIARQIIYLDENNVKKMAYESCERTNDRIYLNQSSFLYSKKPPFISYTDIMENKKKYMNNVTEISDISLLYKHDYHLRFRKSQYLTDPRPVFDRKNDQLVSMFTSTFGKKQWELPPFMNIFEEDSLEKYCWFARCLLEGQVFDFFKALKKIYCQDPSKIKISNLSVAVQQIVNKLKNNQIDSSHKLIQIWKEEPEFLLNEIFLWVQNQYHNSIRKKWPPQKQQEI